MAAHDLDLAGLQPLIALIVELTQPIYRTLQAQAAATVQLTDEIRAVRVVLEASVAGRQAGASDGPSVDDDQVPDTSCVHPDASRVPFASSGSDDFYCKACAQMVLRPHAHEGLN